jgi:nicotinamidase-related amidase
MKKTITLDLRRTALLLVDFQEEQRQHPNVAVAGFENVMSNARKLLLSARTNHIRVFHSAYRRDFDICPQRPFEPLAADGTPAFSDKTSPLTAICKEVEPANGESVIFKNDASAFSEGTLQPAMTKAEIEWVIIAGVWTEACVAASVRDAMMAGFRVLLIKDACGSGTEAMHQTAVLNIANRLYGGAVTGTAKALKLMSGKEADVWVLERPAQIRFNYSNAIELYDSL